MRDGAMDKTLAAQLEQFQSGESRRAYTILGCHRAVRDEQPGYLFRVWAPNAKAVSIRLLFMFSTSFSGCNG